MRRKLTKGIGKAAKKAGRRVKAETKKRATKQNAKKLGKRAIKGVRRRYLV